MGYSKDQGRALTEPQVLMDGFWSEDMDLNDAGILVSFAEAMENWLLCIAILPENILIVSGLPFGIPIRLKAFFNKFPASCHFHFAVSPTV